MWYEILPSACLVGALTFFPYIFTYWANRMVLGQPYRRFVSERNEMFRYLRDARLSDRTWAYDFYGLENIPDQPVDNAEDTSSSSSSSKSC